MKIDKKEFVIHISDLKHTLIHGLVLEKVRRALKLNQEAWLKPYLYINTELRRNAKNDFEKDFLS